MVTDVIVAALLGVGVIVELTCVGVVIWLRWDLARLHFLGPVTTIGATAIVAAVAVETGFSLFTIKASIALGLLWMTGPVVTHALARAAHIRHRGELEIEGEEVREE